MTDKDVVTALKYCADINCNCEKCSLYVAGDDDCQCARKLKLAAIDLICRQKAEIERLKADVVEVRHGNWYGTIVNNVRRVDCSECGATYALVDIEGDLQDLFYCPNCGAKMDGKDEKR